MADFILRKDDQIKKIVRKKGKVLGYKMTPKLKKRKNMVEIKEVLFIHPEYQKRMCQMQFQVTFRRLTSIVLSVTEDEDATSGDSIIALSEIERIKTLVLDQYLHYISKEEVKKMLRKLSVLEQEIQAHIVNQNINQQLEYMKLQAMSPMEKEGRSR